MKKYVLKRDDKITKYIIICFVVTLLNNISMTFAPVPMAAEGISSAQYQSHYYGAIMYTVFAGIIVFAIIMSKIMTTVYLDETKIKKVTVFSKKMIYKDIHIIKPIDNYILVQTNYSQMKINVFDFENNREKYREIVKTLVEKSNVKFLYEKTLKTIENNYHNQYAVKKGEELHIGGVIRFLIWWYIISMVSIISTYAKEHAALTDIILGKEYLFTISIALQLLVTLLVIIAIISKKKRAPKMIPVLLFIKLGLEFLFSYTGGLGYYLFIDNSFGISDCITSLCNLIVGIIIILIFNRYFIISRRVSATFTRDGKVLGLF